MREKEGYRSNYAMLNAMFPHRACLNIQDVMQFLGLSRNTVKRYIKFNEMGLVTKADFARQISV